MSEKFEVDTVVIGAGVVGLAVARALAMSSKEVLVVEQNAHFGMETSSRNSEVIHAGIYYPKNSLKAQLCVRGKQLLYEYCEQEKIPHKRCGKLIVAVNESQKERLQSISEKAFNNGVKDIEHLDKSRAQALEPSVDAVAALLSPSTGIIDSHALMTQLLADLERHGGQLALNTQITKIENIGSLKLICADGTELLAKRVVNAAGLSALALLEGVSAPKGFAYQQYFFARGDYFSYSGKTDFSHLIYPVPENGGLGIHLTLDMQGAARFGPDVTWLDIRNPQAFRDDPGLYQVKAEKVDKFYEAIKTYWPKVERERLNADYSGMRPKLSGPDQAAADFVIQDESDHGVPGLINLLGVESPGLTSCLAIAEFVCKRM